MNPEVEEEYLLMAQSLTRALTLPMVLNSVIELNILDVMVAGGVGEDAWLSPSEIVSQLPTKNPEAAEMLDRMLRLLACYNVVKCKVQAAEQQVGDDQGHESRVYGIGPIGKLFIKNQGQADSSSTLLMKLHQDKSRIASWCHLTDAFLEGGIPFVRANGKPMYKYQKEDPKLNQIFNQAMFNLTTLMMTKLVDTYKGFEKIRVLVDVGGGTGANLSIITSKYPHIKGINFELPQALDVAAAYPGIEYIVGNMFEKVPSGDAIFLKSVLHNWSDDHCITLLKNCYQALPDDNGFVIVIEPILPAAPDESLTSIWAYQQDLSMIAHSGGKERTKKEFEMLARRSGFSSVQVICSAYGFWIMEFHRIKAN